MRAQHTADTTRRLLLQQASQQSERCVSASISSFLSFRLSLVTASLPLVPLTAFVIRLMVVTRISNTRRGERLSTTTSIATGSPQVAAGNGDEEEQETSPGSEDRLQQRQHQQHDDEVHQMTTKQKVQGSGEQIVQVNGNNIMHPTGEEAPHSPAPADGEVQQLMPLPASPRLNHSEEDPPVIEPEGSDQPAVPDVVSDGRSSSKRKHEDVDEESDATDVESDDFEEEVENDDDEEEDDAFDASEGQEAVIQSPASTTIATATTTTPVSIKSRRPSRSCKPNSLIFNSDTTTLSPKRRRKLVNNGQAIGSTAAISKKSSSSHQQSPSPSSDLIHSQRTGSRKSTREHHKNKQQQPAEQQPLISSRSFARESVRKAVSALTGLNRPVKKLGRPRKYPIEMTGESVNPIKNGRIAVGRGVKGRKVVRGKKLTVKKGSPAGKCTPILTAILSGQSLAQTKTGRPKGRPRVLPSLDEVILNGAKSSPNTSATRSSPRRCDCEAKYKKILSNLEQSLEVKFAESTHKLRKDMEHTEAENSRLQNRIVSLQRELDYLKNRLDHAKETTASRQEIDELKLKHQYELSLAKRTQWCANCERESIYFCCWNSSYCSLECQQHHWHAVHKKVCRNKDVKR